MMKKILVTTDFSPNSKAGIRFAIQLASQHNYELTFFHSHHLAKPTGWNDKVYATFEKTESEKIRKKLGDFVRAVYRSTRIKPGQIRCVSRSSFVADSNIMNYAVEGKFSFICISRSGEGKFTKLFGTNTTNLVEQSEVPVIAVPNNYRRSKISDMLFAADLSDINNELQQVVDFARPIAARIKLLHFKEVSDTADDLAKMEKAVGQFHKDAIQLQVEDYDYSGTLISNMEKVIEKSKLSMLVMFSQQKRGFLEKLFRTSNASALSLHSKLPLLILKKS